MSKQNNLYPIFLKLDQIQTLIVGGGNVGLEKVQFILQQSPDAKIKVIAKEFHPQLIRLAIENNNIKIAERAFLVADLDAVKLVIIATNVTQLNKEIKALAVTKNVLTNVVDNPGMCDFYTAAALNKGVVKIAVSSNGTSPTLAKRLRSILDVAIPNEVDDTAHFLQQVRMNLKGNLKEKIKALNAITHVLQHDTNHTEQLPKTAALQHINLD